MKFQKSKQKQLILGKESYSRREIIATAETALTQIWDSVNHSIFSIVESYKAKAEAFAEEGAIDGARKIPVNSQEQSSAEAQIDFYAERCMQELDHAESIQAEVLIQLQERSKHWKESTLSEVALEKEWQSHRLKSETKAVQWARLPLWKLRWNWKQMQLGSSNGLLDWLNDQLRDAERHTNDTSNMSAKLLATYGRVPPLKRWIDRPFVFYLQIFLLFVVECLVNFGAFQQMNMGGNNLGALTIGIFFALFQAVGAKLAGQAFWNRHWRKLALFTALTLILCSLISLVRWHVADSLVNQVVGVFVNFLIAGFTFYVAYHHEKHATYFTVKRLARKLEKKKLHLMIWIPKIRQQMNHHQVILEQKIQDGYDDAKRHLYDAQFNLTQQLEKTEDRLPSAFNQARSQVEHIRDNAHRTYRNLNQLAREKAGSQSVEDWYKPSAVRPPNGSHIIKNSTAICLLLSLGLLSCQNELPDTTIEFLYDQTDATFDPDTTAMTHAVIELVEDQLAAGHWGNIRVNLSQIGEVSSQKVWTVTLDASPPYWLRNEKKLEDELWQFKKELVYAIEEVAEASEAMRESHIHQNFYHRLHWLQQQQGMKWIVSWSDLILNDGKTNFYQYQLAPRLLLENKEELWQMLETDYPLGDLTGIRLVNYYLPTTQDDDLHEVAKQFFGAYWRDHGMEVEFRTNSHSYQVLTFIE